MTAIYDGWYLLDHHVNLNGGTLPWYTTRRNPVQLIVIHTPEALEDFDPPYDEAERVAKYGATITRASWHDTVDADSIIPMLPPTYTAWHVVDWNSRAIGMEIGAKSVSWDDAPDEWVEGVLRNTAFRARQHAEQFGIPIRRITRKQADAGEKGLIGHAPLDPDRRSDPGATFPWDQLITYMKEDDMPSPKDWTPADWDALKSHGHGWYFPAKSGTSQGRPIDVRFALDRVMRNVDELVGAYRAGTLANVQLAELDDDDLKAIAKVVNDEEDRRDRIRLGG